MGVHKVGHPTLPYRCWRVYSHLDVSDLMTFIDHTNGPRQVFATLGFKETCTLMVWEFGAINITDNPKLPLASSYMAYIIYLIDCTTFMFLSSISLWLVPTALQFLMGTVLEPMTDGAPVKIITASNRMFAKVIIALLTVDHLPLFSRGSSLMLKQMQFLMQQENISMTYMGLLPLRCIVHHWLKEAGKLAEYHFNRMLSMLEMFVWASSVVNASNPSCACRNCSLMCFMAVEI